MLRGRSIKVIFLFVLCRTQSACGVKNISSALSRQVRSLEYPFGTGMGIFFALAVPIDLAEKSVAVAVYFEANYALPDFNSTIFYDKYPVGRGITRRMAYDIAENNLKRAGLPERACLLQTICLASKQSVTNNGLIGDILHIILTPSSSQNENLPPEFSAAETTDNCDDQYKCPVNLLSLITRETN